MGSALRAVLLSTGLLLAGCGGMDGVKVWPFDSSGSAPQARKLANATEYQCEGNKRFHVRMMDNGETAWLIYSDREIGLAKSSSASGTRYTNGVAVLDINGGEASLRDGAAAYTGCKAAGK